MRGECTQSHPALVFLPGLNPYYDFDFQGLPNRLSHQCHSFEMLADTLRGIVNRTLGAAGGAERDALIDYFLAARSGALACERILDVLIANGYRDALPARRGAPIAVECKWWSGEADPTGLLAFNAAYPESELLVVAPDVTRTLTRRRDGIEYKVLPPGRPIVLLFFS